jgi:predicted nucleotidyltransferase component of viral defense system
VNPDALIKVKLEIDTDPPGATPTEGKQLLEPIPVTIRAVSLPAIFAGKVAAMLCRTWKGRVKGRDWYDFVWLTRKQVPLDIEYLAIALKQQGKELTTKTGTAVQEMIREKINTLDVSSAQQDAIAFAHEPTVVEQWNKEYFLSFVDKMGWLPAGPCIK